MWAFRRHKPSQDVELAISNGAVYKKASEMAMSLPVKKNKGIKE